MSEIRNLALRSRLYVLCLQFGANLLLPDHDAGVFLSPQKSTEARAALGTLVDYAFGGLARWDAQYFLHLATHGYTYEPTLAFSPLLPVLVSATARPISWLAPNLSAFHCALLAGVALNVFFFVKAAQALFELSLQLNKDERFAKIAVILFCLNPASVFFSAVYSEALFAWLSFRVMLEAGRWRSGTGWWRLAMPLGLSIMSRSNGTVNCGFVAYYALKRWWEGRENRFRLIFRTILVLSFAGFCYGLIQLYFYYLFCKEKRFDFSPVVVSYARQENLVLAGVRSNNSSPWCDYTPPLSYSYVQSHYWNVGFLNYYRPKQIPNFVLAFPMIHLMLVNAFKYLFENPKVVLSLGLQKELKNSNFFVFIVHGLFLTLFCVCFVHIQVSTRLLASASPLPYWFAAQTFLSHLDAKSPSPKDLLLSFFGTRTQRLLVLYFVGYFFIGTVLFANFLPWT